MLVICRMGLEFLNINCVLEFSKTNNNSCYRKHGRNGFLILSYTWSKNVFFNTLCRNTLCRAYSMFCRFLFYHVIYAITITTSKYFMIMRFHFFPRGNFLLYNVLNELTTRARFIFPIVHFHEQAKVETQFSENQNLGNFNTCEVNWLVNILNFNFGQQTCAHGRMWKQYIYE